MENLDLVSWYLDIFHKAYGYGTTQNIFLWFSAVHAINLVLLILQTLLNRLNKSLFPLSATMKNLQFWGFFMATVWFILIVVSAYFWIWWDSVLCNSGVYCK